ncbi:MAG: hypothetical protein LBG15_11425 [Dysgonamonadaceae bacterium]|jgi:tetratricopeptide (TPR) repeat protein|nr:hypothetical protein [Dysgonamonadaceae bacterium]
MKTKILFILLLSTVNAWAQRELEIEDRSKDRAVFGGTGNEACVTVSAPQNIKPFFLSQNEQKTPAKIDSIGTDVNYHLVFDASPGRERREIAIYVNGYTPVPLKWTLSPKQQLNYYIFDRDSILDNCYNQLMREGMNLLKSGMYEDARQKYESVKGCSKIEDEAKVDNQIALIDSVLLWRNIADADFDRSNYAGAIENFQKIFIKNPSDEYIKNRLADVRIKQREDCAVTFRMAESYFEKKDYKQAQSLYEKIIARSCNESSQALEKLHHIELTKELPHALTYEFSKNTAIGLSTGNYKEHKSSGYFTLRLNVDLFELVRTKGDEQLRPELNVSFGWTLKLVKPVWIFFGPGYTGVGEYKPESEEETGENEETKLSLKINHAVSPEIGLLGKIKITDEIGIVMRYTFQYRFALEKESIDHIGQTRHVLGIGFCF